MISIFSIIWILSLVNCIRADQCTQTSPCSCNYESGFGYDLHALEKEMFDAFVPNITGIQYILNLCSDKTIRPNYLPILQDNCDPGFAVMNEEAITVSENIKKNRKLCLPYRYVCTMQQLKISRYWRTAKKLP